MGVGSDDAGDDLPDLFNAKPDRLSGYYLFFYDVWADMLRIPYEVKPLDAQFQIRKEDYYGENGGVIFPTRMRLPVY